ncbi:3-dehydroquinate dehydratase [Oceanobacillus iheyensis HTE831]|uniref:3-dehydroquinate dehydratase n=1 Tax=Oceanobacillus iheyensis (strain DSM 14371 / CIP 107618 / JCM 11309 / KCTC 3954 / HTE831) TaxID=221109 RepID=Q8ET34_OCEIH|nr:type I 3-dehydroquinate dehydratase [Oceanobacillus iheyensis]BAC12386.1 3-dehydroquinate dehydratase [Oceanobacillus iheyensis HTE831]
MKNVVHVKNINIGEGKPKVCVPITGATKKEISEELDLLQTIKVDLVEWRGDLFQEIENEISVKNMLQKINQEIPHLPLLFTFRTKGEGGGREVTLEKYKEINRFVIESKLVDLVDVELFRGKNLVKELVSFAHLHDQKVIISNHDFNQTPPRDEIIARLKLAADNGADIGKIAVMPRNDEDVLNLLSATSLVKELNHIPIVTMSMGADGLISRLSGEVFGSAITFASGKTASAPGQIEAEKLQTVLTIIHDSINKKK